MCTGETVGGTREGGNGAGRGKKKQGERREGKGERGRTRNGRQIVPTRGSCPSRGLFGIPCSYRNLAVAVLLLFVRGNFLGSSHKQQQKPAAAGAKQFSPDSSSAYSYVINFINLGC